MLILRRARAGGSWTGLFSFPGGRVEFGERLIDALHREVREETSLAIDIAGFAGFREAVLPEAGPPRTHFLILCFAARWLGGEPVLDAEHDEYRWAAPDALAGVATTPGLIDLARTAVALVG